MRFSIDDERERIDADDEIESYQEEPGYCSDRKSVV